MTSDIGWMDRHDRGRRTEGPPCRWAIEALRRSINNQPNQFTWGGVSKFRSKSSTILLSSINIDTVGSSGPRKGDTLKGVTPQKTAPKTEAPAKTEKETHSMIEATEHAAATPSKIHSVLLATAIVAALAACRTGGSETSSVNVAPQETSPNPASSSILFQVPPCLPQCTSADVPQLTASSATEAAIVAAIQGARESVMFSMYTFSRKPIFDALVDAARRGVRVQGIMDRAQFKTTNQHCRPGGCTFAETFANAEWQLSSVDIRLERASSDPMFRDGNNTDKLAILLTGLSASSGSEPSGIRPAPGSDRLVHNKYVLIDQKTLLSGSGNWSSTAVSVNLENLVRIEREGSAPVIDGILCSFKLFWQGDSQVISQRISSCQREDVLYLSPAPRSGPHERIIKAINDAAVSIRIAMHHLVDPDVMDALVAARRRGVAVLIATDDDHCNARPDARLTELLEAGAEIRHVPTTCSIFQLSHSKYGIFDDALVINGSANWSKAGLRRNYENFMLFRTAAEVAAFKANFEKLWQLGVTAGTCRCDRTQSTCREKYCMDRPR